MYPPLHAHHPVPVLSVAEVVCTSVPVGAHAPRLAVDGILLWDLQTAENFRQLCTGECSDKGLAGYKGKSRSWQISDPNVPHMVSSRRRYHTFSSPLSPLPQVVPDTSASSVSLPLPLTSSLPSSRPCLLQVAPSTG